MKTIRLALLVLTIECFNACTQEEKNQARILNEHVRYVESQNDSLIDLFATTLIDIDQNLQMVKEKEGLISIGQGSDAETTIPQREKIIKSIQMINALMEENKAKLTELSAKLNNSKHDNKNLKKLIHNTALVLKQKEEELAQLRVTLEQNNYTIRDLTGKLKDADVRALMLIEYGNKFEKQSYTGYFTCGTFKELEKEGVIERKGGILGIGKKPKLNSGFDANEFTQIDIREITSFPVNGKKAELVTAHPSGSYEIKKDENNKVSSLEITDPERFWKASKYMVLAVKQ